MGLFKIKKKNNLPDTKKGAKGKETKGSLSKKKVVIKKKTTTKMEGEAWKVLRSPHITEKAAILADENQYIFNVYFRSNKRSIKKAVENLYGVKVVSVKVLKIAPKKRRLGRVEGWRKGLEKGHKKAIVKISKGQKIEILPR